MEENVQARIQKAVNGLVRDIEHTPFRKMQGDMHRCAAKCCDTDSLTLDETQNCIESCSKDLTVAQDFVQKELSNYQSRLQRCVLQCHDTVRDRVLPSTTDEEVNKLKANYEKCVVQCADTHIDLIPSLLKRMREVIASKRY